ncbi:MULTISPECIES: hypothetical protein [Phenylobacterium]|uniref:Copper export protein n=1 Tax=Phenylobacterium koreense TaxID=266125 RepID=A0ABV2EJB5_9CAUL
MNLLVVKRVLGLASIAAGLVAVAAPDRVARFLGLRFGPQAMSAFGAREIAAGAGLLSPVPPGPWFWMRAGGDLLDLTALARAIGRDNPRKKMAYAAFAAVAAIAVVDLAIAAHATANRREDDEAAA